MFVVLALGALATTLFISWTQEALRVRRTAKNLHQKAQADWLLYAGFGRGVARLKEDTAYDGETWLLDAETIGQPIGAEVRIGIRRDDGRVSLTCRVRMPPDDNHGVQLTHTLLLNYAPDLSTQDRGEP